MAALLAVGALLLTACGGDTDDGNGENDTGQGSGFNGAVGAVLEPTSDATGGTLRVGIAGDCDSWDPQRTYYTHCWNLQRLFTRTLMAYAPEPGSAGTEVVPDLAEGPGEAEDDNKRWTYTLREGVTWDDGAPITSADVKYGIQRVFATDVITGGPSQMLCLLSECDESGASSYAGPYADGAEGESGGLDSIETPDDRTIVFNLVTPYASWDNLMAFPTAAPVPAERDTRGRYGREPAASGPFKVASYDRNERIVFERNDQWDPESDDVRRPLVDGVEVQMFRDAKDIDQRLRRGTLDAPGDGPVQQALQARILGDDELKERADNPTRQFVRWIVASPNVEPFDDVHCRRAVQYAVNKSDLLLARGGEYGGEVAHSIVPKDYVGFDADYVPYPNGEGDQGDLDRARQELEECGRPDGFTTKMAYPAGDDRSADVFDATQRALARVGIELEGAPGDGEQYFGPYIGSPTNVEDNGRGLFLANWTPDFQAPIGFWEQIVSSNQIRPIGNFNWGLLRNDEIDGAVADLMTAGSADEQAELSRRIDELVMDEAVYVPYVHDKVLYLRSDRVVNTYVHQGLGGFYDFVNMGVQE